MGVMGALFLDALIKPPFAVSPRPPVFWARWAGRIAIRLSKIMARPYKTSIHLKHILYQIILQSIMRRYLFLNHAKFLKK